MVDLPFRKKYSTDTLYDWRIPLLGVFPLFILGASFITMVLAIWRLFDDFVEFWMPK